MYKLFFVLSIILLAGTALPLNAQSPAAAAGGPVKWEGVTGRNSEFLVYLPQGYQTSAKDRYFLGKPGSAPEVDRQVVMARYINGVALIFEYYQGNAAKIQAEIQKREKAQDAVSGQAGKFRVVRLPDASSGPLRRVQYFIGKNDLYVLKAVSTASDMTIADAFMNSVRVMDDSGKLIAPNAPAGAKTTILPKVIEVAPEAMADADAIEAKDADRKPIVLYSEAPRFSPEARRGIGSFRIKMKVLYSSSGKVTDVEVVESPLKTLDREAIEAAKRTVFIPAEKGGKLVSVYQTMEFSFGIGPI